MASIEVTGGFNKLAEPNTIVPDVQPSNRTVEEPITKSVIKNPITPQLVPGFNNLEDPVFQGSEGVNELKGQVDDLTPELVQNEQDKQVMDNLEFLKNLKQSSTEQPKVGIPESPEDPWGIRVLNDLYVGATEFSTQLDRGVKSGVVETITAMDELAVWLNNNVTFGKTIDEALTNFYKDTGIADTVGIDTSTSGPSDTNFQPLQARTSEQVALEAGGEELIKTLQTEAQSFTGGATKSISQFLVGFLPTLKALKIAAGGTSFAKNYPWLAATFNSILASSSGGVTFDPQEDRLSNLLKDLEATPEIAQPIFEYLSTSPDDSRAEGRFKTALESMGLTVVGEGLIKALTAIKYLRNMKGETTGLSGSADVPEGAIPSIKEVTTTRTVPEGIQPNSKEFFINEMHKNDLRIVELRQKQKAGITTIEESQELIDAIPFQQVYADKIAKAKTSAEIAESKATVKTKEQTFSAQGKKETVKDIEGRLGAPAQGAVRTSGFLTKEGKFVTPEEARKLAQAELVAGTKFKFAGRPGQAFGDEAAEQGFLNGKHGIGKVVDTLDTGVLANTGHINEAILRLTKLSQFKFKKGDVTDLKVLEKLSRRLGVDVQNLVIRQPDLAANPAKAQA